MTEPEPDRIGIILTETEPDFKPKKVNRIRPDWPKFLPDFKNFNTQFTSHKHKYSSFNFRYELKGKARTRPDNFRFDLGPCAQCCPFEASEKTWGQKPKSAPKEIKL